MGKKQSRAGEELLPGIERQDSARRKVTGGAVTTIQSQETYRETFSR